ncbi:hypothetical protein TNIN_94461 [Trichonephila inaurata madagascariensis]|uniref:Uncharacterized protein n=1 Tax=Trichonephila inaurata madagascariensis TaxID=2747483 RepID=A0A8X7C8Z8_9ARAC|nr:hypothetical protein TNIN_94461 [Trichonephila inaurata madagascariensis]
MFHPREIGPFRSFLIHHEKEELRLLGEEVAVQRKRSGGQPEGAAKGSTGRSIFSPAMPLRKGFCHRLKTLVNGGLEAKLMREEGFQFWARFPELEREENPEDKPLSCYDLIGAFIVYLFGISLSLVVFLYELC